MIIPEIDMPGHATAATRAYPEISGGGEGKMEGLHLQSGKRGDLPFPGECACGADHLISRAISLHRR